MTQFGWMVSKLLNYTNFVLKTWNDVRRTGSSSAWHKHQQHYSFRKLIFRPCRGAGMFPSCVKRCRWLWGRGSYWEQKPNESLSSFRGLNYPAAPFLWPTDLFQRFTKGVNDPWPLWEEGSARRRREEDEGGWRRMKVSLRWSDPAYRRSQQTDRPTLLFETRSGWSAASSGCDPTLSGDRTMK